jgi:hypothetical protein
MNMNKKLSKFALICLVGLIATAFASMNQNLLASADPYVLSVYAAPSRLPADNSLYNNLLVQLQDITGTPVRAPIDIAVQLSSSLVSIGTVPSTVLIPKGFLNVAVGFTTTFTSGSTVVTATASGFASGQATITTVSSSPSRLAVYGLPSVLPSDGGSYGAVVVQLQDANGLPAKPPTGNTQVTLFSSNTRVGTVDATVVIPAGRTFAAANFKTVFNVTGSTTVTAICTSYLSGTATFTTQNPSAQSSQLQIFLGPTTVPADGNSYQQVAVLATDANGVISQMPTNLAVTLTSSSPQIGTTSSSVTILAGKSFAVASFTSTFQPGTAIITVSAPNYPSSQTSITTTGSIPSRFEVYGFPSSLPANQQAYNTFVVQLQDSQGNPTLNPYGATVVNLYSSNPTAGSLSSSTLTIPYGQNFAVGRFQTTIIAASTIITAQATGYGTGQTQLTTYQIDQSPLSIRLNADKNTLVTGKSANLTASVTYADGTPTSSAAVQIVSNNGGSISPITSYGNGTFTATFTSPSVSATTIFPITATATLAGYQTASQTLQITVTPTNTTINITLTADQTTLIVGRTSKINARVAYSDGTPVLGATVQFASINGGSFSSVVEQGNGNYAAVFTPTATPNQVYPITATAYSLGNTASATTQITVIQTALALSVSTSQSTANPGAPINVIASVTYSDGAPATSANVQFFSNSTGYFSQIITMGDGSYTSTFTTPAVSGTTNIVITAAASVPGFVTVLKSVPITINGLAVTISASPSILAVGKATNITAHVAYSDGTPVLGATVQFSSRGGGSFTDIYEQGNGNYQTTFTPLAALNQTYTIMVNVYSQGSTTSTTTQVTVANIITTASANPNAINNGETSTITARVTYSDQTPVIGANLQFSSSLGGTFFNITDYGDGTYSAVFAPTLVASTTAANIIVSASTSGATANTTTQLTVIFSLTQTGVIQVHVQDQIGNPLSDALVASTSQPLDMVILSQYTNSTGDVVFFGASSGSYTLQISKPGYITQNQTFTLTSTQTSPVTVTLSSQTSPSWLQTFQTPIIIVVAIVVVAATVALAAMLRRNQSKSKSTEPASDQSSTNEPAVS